jgi:hypothetical protein
MSDSSLQCVETAYSSGSAFTTLTYSILPYYSTLTFPATSTASSTFPATRTASSTFPATSAASNTFPPATSAASSTAPSHNGAIIGGVVGSVVFVITVVALLLFYFRRRKAVHIVTVENNKAIRPELDSEMENSLPQVPFYSSLPRQSFTESRTPGPDEVPPNSHSVSEMDTRSQTTIETPERSPRSASVPRPMRPRGSVKDQSTRTEGMALGPANSSMSPLPSAPRAGPDRESSVAAGGRQDLRPELEILRAEVERLRQIVIPLDDAPPGYHC